MKRTSERLHVVQIAPCHVDPQTEAGGVANLIRQISLGIARRGHKVSLICTTTELGQTVATPGIQEFAGGITVFKVQQNANPLLGPHLATKKVLDAVFMGNRSLATIAHVHTCFSSQTETAMRYLASHQIPYIFSPHGKLSPNMLDKHRWAKMIWWNLFAKRGVNGANHIGLTSRLEATFFSDLRISCCSTTIPNGFSNEVLPKIEYMDIPYPYILFLGYLDPRKQPDFLIKAFAKSKVAKTHKLLVVGPDKYGFKKQLEKVATEYLRSDQIVFWGSAYGSEKVHLLSNASCICLPTLGEGHPLVLCEALGAGTPSIFSQHANFSEAAYQGAGVEINGFQVQEWASAIDKVVLDTEKNKKMRTSALQMAPSFTWDAIVQKWERLYCRAMEN